MSWVVAGTAAFNVVAGAQQAETIRANAQITKQVSNLNASYADVDAYNASQQGITKVARYQDVIDQTIGAQKTDMAAKNVDVSFGTAAEIGAQTKLTGYLNQLDIKNQADQSALGYKIQANNIRLSGATGQNAANIQAQGALTGGELRGLSTLVSGYTPTRQKLPGKNFDVNWAGGDDFDGSQV